MRSIKLSREVTRKADEQFPDIEIEFDREGVDIAPKVVFRSLIRLDSDEVKEYHAARTLVQQELRDKFEQAQVAAKDGDEAALNDLTDMDPTQVVVDMLREQLAVLATDREAARAALAALEKHEVLAIHQIVVKDAASGE